MKILYVGSSDIGSFAPNVHVAHNVQLLDMAGAEVALAYCENDMPCASDDTIQRFTCASKKRKGRLAVLAWLWEEIVGRPLYHTAKRAILAYEPACVILYSRCLGLALSLRQLCKKRAILYVDEVVDWFDPRDADKPALRLVLQAADLKIRRYNQRADKVIAISPFLEDYYQSKGCDVLLLPPVYKLAHKPEFTRHTGDPVHLFYAGSPGKNKDFIDPLVHAFLKLHAQGYAYQFTLAGISYENLAHIADKTTLQAVGLKALGRISNTEVQQHLSLADFGFLLRENKLYAKAGFSTKFAEYMCHGVAPICTPVGGADSLIEHGRNGLLVEKNSVDNILSCLARSWTPAELETMKTNAFETACKYFSMDSYILPVQAFFDMEPTS